MERQLAREQLKNNLKDYVESITTKSKGANMYVCPLCSSGTGPKGTGAFSIKGNKWKCFSCNEGGDIYDLIGAYEHIEDKSQQLIRAGDLYGVEIDTYTTSTASNDFREYQNQDKTEQYTHTHIHTNTYTQSLEQAEDYTAFYLEANKNLDKTDYYRGISKETLSLFKVGYKENWKHPKAPHAPATPRLIIPTSKHSYLARDTREEIPANQRQYSKSKVGKVHIFNAKALEEAQKPIFIVEGEIDALSIIDAGGQALALGSAGNVRKLLELLKEYRPIQKLILALDNDTAGKKACSDLEQGLKELEIDYMRSNPSKEYKDANEAYNKARDKFIEAVLHPKDLQEELEELERQAYLKTSVKHHVQSFINGIADQVNTPSLPTGFSILDAVLDGGLYEGLYIVGAISSLGKTTLITQIADQIAQAGQDVLIFSLEMARNEIIAKSLSRHTLLEVMASGGDTSNAKTVRGITSGDRYNYYSQEEKELIFNSINKYAQYSDRIYISEGVGDIGALQIKGTVEKHIKYTGNKPLVIIDYLQILAPHNERATDKQNTDKAVMELKRISRDFKIPVIGISSFNRESYKDKVTMASFKESGAIEYSSDVLIGLQLNGAGEKGFNVDDAKSKNPREVELVILKNRNGSTGNKIRFNYYPLFNYFEEAQGKYI